MTTKELQEQHPEIFQKIGGIIYNLNRIETSVITVLSVFFTDISNPHSEKAFIFNDALFDENIFPSFESKRRMLIKVIKNLWRVAEEHHVSFDKDRWLELCKSMNKIQGIRNELAHHSLGFLPDGKVRYQVRKTNEERLNDQKVGRKTGTVKFVDIDLDKGLRESQEVCDETEKFIAEFLPQANGVLRAQFNKVLLNQGRPV